MRQLFRRGGLLAVALTAAALVALSYMQSTQVQDMAAVEDQDSQQLLSRTGRTLLDTGASSSESAPSARTPAHTRSKSSPAARQNPDVPARMYYGGYGQYPGYGYDYGSYGSYGSYGYGGYPSAEVSDSGFAQPQLEGQSAQPPYQYQLSNAGLVPAGNLNRTATGAYSQEPSLGTAGVAPGGLPIFTTNTSDASQGSWSVVGHSGSIAIHISMSPSNELLFFERPHTTGGYVGQNPYLTREETVNGKTELVTEVASVYNLTSNSYRPVRIRDAPFCAGHIYGPTGTTIIVGGDDRFLNYSTLVNGLSTIREFDFGKGEIVYAQNISSPRWYPTLATLPSGNVLIVGGSIIESGGYYGNTSQYNNPTYQVYSPTQKTATPSLVLQQLVDAWPIVLYPFVYVLPHTGSLAIFAGRTGRVYRSQDFTLDTSYGAIPSLAVPFSHPQTAGSHMLDLDPARNYTASVIIFGGCSTDRCAKLTDASPASWRTDLTDQRGSWLREEMPAPRVMPWSCLLPDGTVFVMGGAENGYAGGFPSYGFASNPVTRPTLYNASGPVGKRWSSLLADSSIPRLYHSSLMLLRTGEVLVAGSEVTLEYRIQVYTPPYLLTGQPRPSIERAPDSVTWGQNFTVAFMGTAGIDRVVLNKLADNTHCISMDHRQVVLEFGVISEPAGDSWGYLTATAPPDATIAPQGTYMLFILYQGVPAEAEWIQVQPNTTAISGTIPRGTYYLQSRAATEVCSTRAKTKPQFLTRPSDCSSSAGLSLHGLRPNETLAAQWEIGLVPGSQTAYYLWSASSASSSCNTTFLGADSCSSSAPSEATLGPYQPRLLQWDLTPVPDVANGYLVQAVALDDEGRCGPYLAASSADCGQEAVQTQAFQQGSEAQQWLLIPAA